MPPLAQTGHLAGSAAYSPTKSFIHRREGELRKLFDLPEATHWETCPVLSSAAMCSQCLRLMDCTKGLYHPYP